MNSPQYRTIELLSPAKNLECGMAAIKHGADAVYIGGPGFGARKNAGNSLSDIEELINYAHLFGVKVYITLNTLLFDHEIDEANQLIHAIYKIGADAVIIQDMGLLETKLPSIEIHASTQTDNRTVEKVKFLEDVGFSQVVLARELSIEQIKEIKQDTSVPLEYFIHGALCVCYSGQCYMSASINKRSANRGECAQPCRLKYSLKDKNGINIYKDKHLLSLKDLNLTSHIEALIDAGITSFKIEGRLKDKDYVANITAHYRQIIDSILKKRNDIKRASSGLSHTSFKADATKSFNRGFTNYFVNGREKGIWSIDSPKNIGEELGQVKFVAKDHFVISSNEKLTNGDGLTYFTKNKELNGVLINKIEGNKIYPNNMKGIAKGMLLYRNFDKAFTDAVAKNNSQRTIPVDILFVEKDNQFELSIRDANQLETSIICDLTPSTANNPERALDQIKIQISKLGNTVFHPDNVRINLKNDWFFQAKELNAARRLLIEKHETKRRMHFRPKDTVFKPNSVPFPKIELNYTANIINEKAQHFYARHGVKKSDWGFEKQTNIKGAELMRTKHCVLYMNNQCLKEHPEVRKLLPLTLYNKKDNYRLEFDCKNCEMIVKREK
ncbi:U32 family peptidase [Carboxylicivirga sp. A043]|uniref:peptidase U32 family protein n=1 Tax=Carboxylicivirga litoralis TaxID=2816963 RepID=UPI0021CB8983|nr:U32 family peptidase [Carboxylicivirga sp. A043]MCU4157686.1 U32 family peptidase [Carboxylicivirga sp. A043]